MSETKKTRRSTIHSFAQLQDESVPDTTRQEESQRAAHQLRSSLSRESVDGHCLCMCMCVCVSVSGRLWPSGGTRACEGWSLRDFVLNRKFNLYSPVQRLCKFPHRIRFSRNRAEHMVVLLLSCHIMGAR